VGGAGVRKYERVQTFFRVALRPFAISAMISHPHIRSARASDLDALIELEHHTFTTDRISRAQYRRHIAGATAAVLVAENHALLGSVVVFFRRNSDAARLYSVGVSHHARGQGLGDILVDAAEKVAQQRGSRRIFLEVRHDNAGAIRLYERRGYVRIGTIPGFYEDGEDAWRYEKTL
jgi:[ribosomal protein S18]-alanine N-acetyltransferase